MLITINDQDPRPVYIQIAGQVKEQIQRGELKAGDELPSVRELAGSLGINMHTVRHAYSILRDQNLLVFRLGQQAKVASLRSQPAGTKEIATALNRQLDELLTEAFLLGLSADDFRNLINEKINQRKEQKK
ncbi:MAG: GntR family transcriptional regulator [Dehalococcoidia bacterium]|nr:GntR family transcriptional regulator [Dehalococcoidia bacterium]MDD5494089.1 GntR family transcriptional regulator [Dehalococcoidia bacterium]